MSNSRRTFIEELDSRTKLLALLLLGMQLLVSRNPWILIISGLIVLLSLLLSPVSFRATCIQLQRIFWFVVFITAINAVTESGTVLFQFLGMYITEEGMLKGLTLSVRIALLALLSFVFARSTTIAEVVDSVEALLAPFRKRLGAVIAVLSLTLNFVPLMIQSAQRIKAAQRSRGADIDSSFFRQVKFASQAALPLFVSAFRSSQHLADAMDARCYDPSACRTPIGGRSMSARDWMTILCLGLFPLVLMYLT